jgi:hypothetical protein
MITSTTDILAPALDGFLWFGLGDVGGPDLYAPIVFERELETYLKSALGIPIWADVLPQGITQEKLPGLVYNLISVASEEDLSGPTDICEWLVQFDAYARSRIEAATLAERLRAVLHGYSGPMGAAWVLNAERENGSHGYEALPSGSGQTTKRRSSEYRIWFRESKPLFETSIESTF